MVIRKKEGYINGENAHVCNYVSNAGKNAIDDFKWVERVGNDNLVSILRLNMNQKEISKDPFETNVDDFLEDFLNTSEDLGCSSRLFRG